MKALRRRSPYQIPQRRTLGPLLDDSPPSRGSPRRSMRVRPGREEVHDERSIARTECTGGPAGPRAEPSPPVRRGQSSRSDVRANRTLAIFHGPRLWPATEWGRRRTARRSHTTRPSKLALRPEPVDGGTRLRLAHPRPLDADRQALISYNIADRVIQ